MPPPEDRAKPMRCEARRGSPRCFRQKPARATDDLRRRCRATRLGDVALRATPTPVWVAVVAGRATNVRASIRRRQARASAPWPSWPTERPAAGGRPPKWQGDCFASARMPIRIATRAALLLVLVGCLPEAAPGPGARILPGRGMVGVAF